jgi:hypothetical protein
LANLKDVIDSESFKMIDNSFIFYKDRNHVYVHQQFPATFPPVKIIEIKPQEEKLLNQYYIKDSTNVYWLGIKLDTNSRNFHLLRIDKENKLAADNKYIFRQSEMISKEDLMQMPISKSQKDSIYFPNE